MSHGDETFKAELAGAIGTTCTCGNFRLISYVSPKDVLLRMVKSLHSLSQPNWVPLNLLEIQPKSSEVGQLNGQEGSYHVILEYLAHCGIQSEKTEYDVHGRMLRNRRMFHCSGLAKVVQAEH